MEGTRVIAVRGVGKVAIRHRLTRERARELVKAAMRPEISATRFRDMVLEATVDVSLPVQEAARHRLALEVLRTWAVWPAWRRLYGSGLPLEDRLRRVIVPALREQARPHTLGELGEDVGRVTSSALARTTHLGEVAQRHVEGPARALRHLARAMAPAQAIMAQVRDWLERTVGAIADAFREMVREPVERVAAEALRRRAQLGAATGPIARLLQAHQRHVVDLLATTRQARLPALAKREPAALIVPDQQDLVAVFVGEMGDRKWAKSPAGWLLRVVPLPLGRRVHALFAQSSEVALAWLGERMMRRELRRVIEPPLLAVSRDAANRDVILNGVDLYLQREWSAADTLLTAGLDGLLFDVAQQRGVLTEGGRLRRSTGKKASNIRTGGDMKLLSAMGFDASEREFLTTLSLGQTGNPPRHGSASPLGSDVHAAGSLLGVMLVLAWAAQDRPLAGRILVAAA